MRRRTVIYAPRAQVDLDSIFRWLSDRAGTAAALRYLRRIRKACVSLELVAERGTQYPQFRPGLRIIGFERRVTIAFVVTPDEVRILRVFYGGQNWAAAFTVTD
jgi:toxin ParE1/3/4